MQTAESALNCDTIWGFKAERSNGIGRNLTPLCPTLFFHRFPTQLGFSRDTKNLYCHSTARLVELNNACLFLVFLQRAKKKKKKEHNKTKKATSFQLLCQILMRKQQTIQGRLLFVSPADHWLVVVSISLLRYQQNTVWFPSYPQFFIGIHQ